VESLPAQGWVEGGRGRGGEGRREEGGEGGTT